MERNTPISNLSYLFGPRLNFVESQEQLKLKCKTSLSQDMQSPQELRLHELQQLIRQLKTEEDIFDAYRAFYLLIYQCRFNRKQLQKTFISSQKQLKDKTNKKNTKDIEDKRKVRVTNSLKKMGISQDDFPLWKQVLNHENISNFICLSKNMLKKVFQQNFELFEQGIIKFKHQQIQKDVKIEAYILLSDIILLINTMSFMFYPFEQNLNSLSIVNQKQKQLFDQAIRKQNKNAEFKIIDSLTVKNLFHQIKSLLSQLPVQQKKLKFWFDLELIRQRYLTKSKKLVNRGSTERLIQENSVVFQLNSFKQDWQNLQKQYPQQIFSDFQQDLSFVFKEFSNQIQNYTNQIFKRNEPKQVIEKFVTEYLVLIKNQWIYFDKSSFEKLYIDELLRLNQILKIPEAFLTDVSQNVLQIISKKVQKLSQFKLQKLKQIVKDISKELVCLDQHDNLVVDYFYRFKESLIELFKQKQKTDKILSEIQNYQRNFQVSEFFITIQKIYQLFKKIKQCKVGQIDIEKDENLDDGIKFLLNTYKNDQSLILQIKYFLTTARAITKVDVDVNELEKALQFYSQRRQEILGRDNIVDKQKLSLLNYGLEQFIRYLIYELILKIRLKVKISELNKDQKLIFRFLKFYHLEREKVQLQFENTMNQRQVVQNQQQNQEQDQDQDQGINQDQGQKFNQKVSQQILRRIKSQQVNFGDFYQITSQQSNTFISNNESNEFAQNFLTHIQQLRIEILRNNIKQLQLKQKPLEEDYISLKNKLYKKCIKQQSNQSLQQDFNQLGQIEYWFVKKRYYKSWRALKKLKDINSVLTQLEKIKRKGINQIKIYIKIYLRYQQIYYHSNLIIKGDDIPQTQVKNIVDDVIKSESDLNITKQYIKQLWASVRILDRIEKVQILRQQITKRQQFNRSIQDANKFKVIRENNQFSQLDKILKIQRIQKMGIPTMKKFIIKCSQRQLKKIQEKLLILRRLSLNNIHIQVKGLEKIQMLVDEVQIQFDSIPKLIKHLIETYYKIINFCQKQLKFQLYPILTKHDFHFQNKGDSHYTLRVNPYEGILFNILLGYADIKKSGKYIYPKHPFVPFSDQIKNQFDYTIIQNLQTCNNNVTEQQFGFSHLIQQIKSISMENDYQDLDLVVQKILKCPYFWSPSDKFFELVEFKQKYHSMVNVEQCRRKQNERIKKSLSKRQQENFDPSHKDYVKCPGFGKTVQMYLNIEGIMQKQAFLEDIGNFRTRGDFEQFSPQTYYWALDKNCLQKKQINKLIKMTAEKKNKKMSVEDAYYKLVFPSFHTKIRNLRNLLSHYTYVKAQKKQYTLQHKLSLIQKSFPKLFVFIYRWKPYLNKNFNEIQEWRQNILLSMFRDQQKRKTINQLKNIDKIKKEYDIFFEKLNVADFFKYEKININGCKACNTLFTIMVNRKNTVWDFLADFKKQKIEQQKDFDESQGEDENTKKQKTPYNHFFWQHKSFKCNGMRFLLPFFMNMVKRSKFTSEEAGQMISSRSQIMLQIERLQKRLKNLSFLQNGSDDQLPTEKEQLQLQKHLMQMERKEKKQRIQQRKRLSREQYFQQYYKEMLRYDNVNKNFIYQLEWEYPHLFDDLRRERYLWDLKAKMFDY